MIQLTKIFRFEMAHAIHSYPGDCKNLHGHSYILHVTVAYKEQTENFLPGVGLMVDFKTLKQWVQSTILQHLDHATVVSNAFCKNNHFVFKQDRLLIWDIEPTAENLLVTKS